MYKLDLEKADKPDVNLPKSIASLKSKRIPEKTSTSLAIIFDCGSQQTGKFFKRWEYQTT